MEHKITLEEIDFFQPQVRVKRVPKLHRQEAKSLVSLEKVFELIGEYYNALHSWQDTNPKQMMEYIRERIN